MRVVSVELFMFDELSDKAKEVARTWFRDGFDYPWWSESLASIKAFCEHFGVKLVDYEISIARPYYFKTDACNAHFRGVKMSDCMKDEPPFPNTGYGLDYTLYDTFRKAFKATGDAKWAFNQAMHAAFRDIVSDIEWHYSDDAVDEMMFINEYEFTADGRYSGRFNWKQPS